MNSYNPIFGVHATENGWLNIDVLRQQWGFRGILMSDWTSVYSTSGAANNGLDLECPKGVYFTEDKLMPLIDSGVVSEAMIDQKVRHLLQTFIAFGMLDNPQKDENIPLDNPVSRNTALEIARQGAVLLKNEKEVLPFRKGNVLVMGPNADRIPTGGGSGFVHPYSTVSVFDGLESLSGKKNTRLLDDKTLFKDLMPDVFTDRSFAVKGWKASYYNAVRPEGEPFKQTIDTVLTHYWKYGSPFKGMPDDKFYVRWEGAWKAAESGLVRISMGGDDGYRVSVNGKIGRAHV